MSEPLSVTIDPCPLKNPLNGSHGHWREHAARRKVLRSLARCYTIKGNSAALRLMRNEWRVIIVTLTRVSPRPFDDDNLRAAFKGVRDGVADALQFDDAHPKFRWEYAQERGKPKQNAVRIEIAEGV